MSIRKLLKTCGEYTPVFSNPEMELESKIVFKHFNRIQDDNLRSN